ncbi:MAG: alpha/beta hydrolase [Micavibrio sp.]|nr:MAG: alpha/beta hydrolase [Micavibrio sp.]
MLEPQYLIRENKPKLAYIHSPLTQGGAEQPMVMFLGGFMSDMNGTKATYLEQQCKARGQEFLRFDYSGHGASEGEFTDGTIGHWKEDALAMFDHMVKGPVILIGSSMGGWIALHLALERTDKIRGLIGIAAAPDFTEGMYHEYLTDEQKQEIQEKGQTELPSDYDAPYIITRALIEDGRKQCLLDREHESAFPMRLIQGKEDAQVPWQTAQKIKKMFKAAETNVILIEDGDHSLSRPDDLALIDREIQSISGLTGP